MIFLSLLLAVLGSSVSLAAPTTSAQNATVDALVYALPLSPYVIVANSMSVASASNDFATNTFVHVTALANASSRTVILPNTDTLYSAALLDLSAGDVVVTMPERELGRFYVLPFYDLYGNNVCSIGTVTSSMAGKYLIQYRPSNAGCDLIPDASDGYAGTISLPTVYGQILLRIEVFNSTDVDHIVSTIQPHFRLTSLLNTPSSGAPPLTSALLNDGLAVDNPPLHLLQLLSRLASFNPAEEASDAEHVATTLEAAGISVSSESYTPPAGVDLASAYTTALNLVQQVPLNPANLLPLSSDSLWSTTLPSLSGDFHTRYDLRAYTSISNALAAGSRMCQGDFGLWLTVYDGEGFLVPNAVDRYSLGDRADLTYPDGTPVYNGKGNGAGGDAKAFYMLLQSTDVEVAAEWEANWLPTPADGAKFSFILRFYGPTLSLTDGTYEYPKITAVDANPPLPISE
ncbi:DUF1254-like protein [Favolaschia claudopus]|uniref:DUF1254-like protein n=1 Tax=Favolaschia claudopus TaxID=2862362 RepID=A0AAV9Z2E4_9AGAR